MTAPIPSRTTTPLDNGAGSAWYDGTVRHRRRTPAVHEFAMPIGLALLDVDHLDVIDGLPLWSRRRAAPMRFRRSDYLDGGVGPLRDALGDIVERELGRRPGGRISMLTQLRTWGWLFNPITVYWCSRADDAATLDVVVLEVTNTPWKERHWYVIDAPAVTATARGVVFPKELHVSPFFAMDLDYRLSFTAPTPEPGSPLTLRLELLEQGTKVFDADLSLRRRPLTRRTAVVALVRHPLQTLRVSASIHGQALRLLLKRVRPVPHPNRSGSGDHHD